MTSSVYNARMGDSTKEKLNLFVIAAENVAVLNQDMGALLSKVSAAHRDSLVLYSERVRRDGRISVNMHQRVLSSFLSLQRHLNMHEWVASVSPFTSIPREEIFRQRLGEFYEPRIAFDSCFEDGQSFRYGALNIGGLGAWFYGEYCILLREEVSGRDVTYLRSDSLKAYVLPGLRIDESAIRRDAAPHAHRHCLAVLKHAKEVPLIAEDQWAGMLCSNNELIEAIFTVELTLDQVESIRMPRPDFEARYRLAFESFRDKTLSEQDRFIVTEFRTTLIRLKESKIPLEVVEC
jgi:hypothetical protein